MPITETAFAKINLALHVRGRRADGYHELETLFAFVDGGDSVTAAQADRDTLSISGDYAGQLTDPFDNIVHRALGAVPRDYGLRIALEKNLPVAAGLGGGSADAGAIFRIARSMGGLPDDWRMRAAKLGADVPVCVDSLTAIGRGTGADIEAVASDLTGTAVLLVNPGIPLATAQVFGAWDGEDRGAMPHGSVSTIADRGRNDLERPAITLVPEIAEVRDQLERSGAFLSRMSGSGATCFALYCSHDAMQHAARTLAAARPEWWQMAGSLR